MDWIGLDWYKLVIIFPNDGTTINNGNGLDQIGLGLDRMNEANKRSEEFFALLLFMCSCCDVFGEMSGGML